jgi:hypothetical protein
MTQQEIENLANTILGLSNKQLEGILSGVSNAQQTGIANLVRAVKQTELQKEADTKKVEAINLETLKDNLGF